MKFSQNQFPHQKKNLMLSSMFLHPWTPTWRVGGVAGEGALYPEGCF